MGCLSLARPRFFLSPLAAWTRTDFHQTASARRDSLRALYCGQGGLVTVEDPPGRHRPPRDGHDEGSGLESFWKRWRGRRWWPRVRICPCATRVGRNSQIPRNPWTLPPHRGGATGSGSGNTECWGLRGRWPWRRTSDRNLPLRTAKRQGKSLSVHCCWCHVRAVWERVLWSRNVDRIDILNILSNSCPTSEPLGVYINLRSHSYAPSGQRSVVVWAFWRGVYSCHIRDTTPHVFLGPRPQLAASLARACRERCMAWIPFDATFIYFAPLFDVSLKV